jgi:hypothetical protein
MGVADDTGIAGPGDVGEVPGADVTEVAVTDAGVTDVGWPVAGSAEAGALVGDAVAAAVVTVGTPVWQAASGSRAAPATAAAVKPRRIGA